MKLIKIIHFVCALGLTIIIAAACANRGGGAPAQTQNPARANQDRPTPTPDFSDDNSTPRESPFEFCETDGGVEITRYHGKAARLLIPDSLEGARVVGIGDGAFADMGLAEVRIPAGVIRIGAKAFYNNPGLTEIVLPENLEYIGDEAFGFTRLAAIVIPSGVTSNYSGVFIGTNLTSVSYKNVSYASAREYHEAINKMEGDAESAEPIMDGPAQVGGAVPAEKPGSGDSGGDEKIESGGSNESGAGTSVVAENPVHDFEYRITEDGIRITGYNGASVTVRIPEKIEGIPVTSIGSYAFYGTGITSVIIPDGVFEIRDGAFMDNVELTRAELGSGLIYIGNGAFMGVGLTSLTIPDGVIEIGDGAFTGYER
ncbi:MAG: leucine-rich repeat domain-containing protein, partial [Defluviitaleaceae bacterium]|nr:leucine-rich repeat domain-containing protein [Defluviitaleaceae bacterium]